MELFKQKFFSSFSFSVLAADANMLWRIVLAGTSLCLLLLGIVATLSYIWATKVDTPLVNARNDKDSLSADEIRSIVEVYKTKQDHFRSLLRQVPDAPELGKDAGAIAPAVDMLNDIPTDQSPDLVPN